MKQLVIYLILISFTSCAVNSNTDITQKQIDKLYFPLFSNPFIGYAKVANDSFSEHKNKWYSKHLKSLKEPVLYKLVSQSNQIIRFTNLGTWSHPYSYRIENTQGSIVGIYSETSGRGGYKAGPRIEHKQKPLSAKTWNDIIMQIDSAGFWEMETHDSNMVLDGEEYILEVLINGKYHVVARTSPSNTGERAYGELCNLIAVTFKQ